MLVHEFDALMDATPFLPFRIYTADGRSVRVPTVQHAWHGQADRTVFVASGQGEATRFHILDVHLVSRFTLEKRSGKNGNGNGGRKHK
jgi:hypothetical protein